MRVLLILVCVLGISQLVVFSQVLPENTGCPVFSVIGPSAAVDLDKPIVFRLHTDRKLNPNEKVFWTVSHGKILSGQGTESIAVENVSGTGMDITAVAEVVGLPKNCNPTAVGSYLICPLPPSVVKVDEFGKVTKEILSAKINNLSQELKKDPSATAIIIKYFKNRPKKLDAYRDLQLIMSYLKSAGVAEDRISFLISFEGSETNEFWIVPAGVALPLSELSNTKSEILEATKLKQKIDEVSKKQ